MADPAPGSAPDLPGYAYALAFVAYVALGYWLKSVVLNWLVGPLFLLIVLHLLPRAIARTRGDGR